MKRLLIPAIITMALSSCSGNKTEVPSETIPNESAENVTDTNSLGENSTNKMSAQDEQKIKEYIASFFIPGKVNQYADGWMEKHCTAELIKQLKDEYPYEDNNGYALWNFEAQEDGEDNVKKLQKLELQEDGSFLATIYVSTEDEKKLVNIKYWRYAASVINGEVVFSQCTKKMTGSLEESAQIWKNNIKQLEKMAKEYNEFGTLKKIAFIDVDEDGIFELFASDKSSVCCYTLADNEGKVNGFKNAKMIAMDPTKYVKLKVKPDAHIVYYSGGIGMGATSEDYYILQKSHVAELYQYTKEVNPLDENEFSEEATVSFGESTRNSSNEEINKNCRSKGNYVLSFDQMRWQYLE